MKINSNMMKYDSSSSSSQEEEKEQEEPFGAIEMVKVIPTASPGSGQPDIANRDGEQSTNPMSVVDKRLFAKDIKNVKSRKHGSAGPLLLRAHSLLVKKSDDELSPDKPKNNLIQENEFFDELEEEKKAQKEAKSDGASQDDGDDT